MDSKKSTDLISMLEETADRRPEPERPEAKAATRSPEDWWKTDSREALRDQILDQQRTIQNFKKTVKSLEREAEIVGSAHDREIEELNGKHRDQLALRQRELETARGNYDKANRACLEIQRRYEDLGEAYKVQQQKTVNAERNWSAWHQACKQAEHDIEKQKGELGSKDEVIQKLQSDKEQEKTIGSAERIAKNRAIFACLLLGLLITISTFANTTALHTCAALVVTASFLYWLLFHAIPETHWQQSWWP